MTAACSAAHCRERGVHTMHICTYTYIYNIGLPQNTLCHADFYHLHEAGGPIFRSIVVSSVAALFRTALRTVTSWPIWIVQLEEAAAKWLPLAPLIRDTLTPSFWDSPPIACNLREASCGFPNEGQWSQGATELIHNLFPQGLVFPPPQEQNRIALQKLVYDKFISHRFVNSLHGTIERRLTSLFLPYALDFQNTILLERCLGILKGLSVSVALRVLKSWCNGWATSRRYRNSEEKLLPCLFGCSGCVDELEHYLQCPHLFSLWTFLAGSTSEDPLVRWGLIRPSSTNFNYIACTFSGYHAIRRALRSQNQFFSYNQNILTGPQLRVAWSVFADTFFVEARELASPCRKFSFTSFLSFLSNAPAPLVFPDVGATLPPVTGTEVVRVDRPLCTSSVNDSPS